MVAIARLILIGLIIGMGSMAHAQPFPATGDRISAGTRVWVSTTSMNDRWQKGRVVEERLHANSYLVQTDAYRGEPEGQWNVHWMWVQRLTDECTPPARGQARIGAADCPAPAAPSPSPSPASPVQMK